MVDGKVLCPIEGYSDVWIEFKTSGYPFSLARTLDKSRNPIETLTIILQYVTAWNLLDINGQTIPLPPVEQRTVEILDNADEVLMTWAVKAFYEVRAELIRSKNSLPPSLKTS